MRPNPARRDWGASICKSCTIQVFRYSHLAFLLFRGLLFCTFKFGPFYVAVMVILYF